MQIKISGRYCVWLQWSSFVSSPKRRNYACEAQIRATRLGPID